MTHLSDRLFAQAPEMQDFLEGHGEDGAAQARACAVVECPGEGKRPGAQNLGAQQTEHQQDAVGQIGLTLLSVLQQTPYHKSL